MGSLLKALPIIAVLLFVTGGAEKLGVSFSGWVERLQVGGGSWTPGPATKSEECRLRQRGKLPDPGCTPGALNAQLTKDQLCGPASRVSHVSVSLRRRLRRAYRAGGTPDLLISAKLGGTVTFANVWPQLRVSDRRRKNRVERQLFEQVCSGKTRLRTAQYRLATNWRTAVKLTR